MAQNMETIDFRTYFTVTSQQWSLLNTQGAKLYVCWQTDMASYKNVSYVD